jgi:hypothetical protein
MNLFSSTAMLVMRMVITMAALILVNGTPANAVTPRDFGGKGDLVALHDGSVSAGTADFHSNSATFATADVGKAIVVRGAGAGGGALVTKIQAFVSAKRVTLAANASASVIDELTYYGTDDTAAIRACVYQSTKGGECTIGDSTTYMVSNTNSIIVPLGAGNLPIRRGIINGHGRIVYAPQGSLVGNDRLFYVTSQEGHALPIAGAIANGATSFKAQNAADAATLSPGDWVIVTEMDSVAGDDVYADWMEVASINGSVVTTTTPFRMAFPNIRPWAGPPKNWGLSFRRIISVLSNFTIRDITIIIPKMLQEKHNVVGIDTRDTIGTVISNVSCLDASGNCFAGYMDKGLTFQDNHINGSVYAEFAGEVDATISGNYVNETDKDLSLPGPPTSGGFEIDFGTGFSKLTENSVGPSRQMCIGLLSGVHDTIVSGNTCGMVSFGTGAACILSRGGYRISVSGNTCAGGAPNGKGIDFGDANLSVPIYSEGNRVFNNRVQGFTTPYSCSGRLRKDTCDQR